MQPGNLRHHLGNKAEVFDIVYDDSIGCVGELLAAELSRNPSPQPGDLVHLVGSMLEGEPDLLAFLALAPLERRRHPELRNHLGDGPAGLETLIRDAVHGWAGQGRVVEGVDPDHLVDVLLAVTYGLLVFATQVDPTVDRPGAVEVLARLIDGRIWRSTG
jgi:AcrR family transcriptional regulator